MWCLTVDSASPNADGGRWFCAFKPVDTGGEHSRERHLTPNALPLALSSWHLSRRPDPLAAAHTPLLHCHDGIDSVCSSRSWMMSGRADE
jgi:hypothetical protein